MNRVYHRNVAEVHIDMCHTYMHLEILLHEVKFTNAFFTHNFIQDTKYFNDRDTQLIFYNCFFCFNGTNIFYLQ